MSITVRFSKEEEILRNIVEAKDTNVSVYLREIVNEKSKKKSIKIYIKKPWG